MNKHDNALVAQKNPTSLIYVVARRPLPRHATPNKRAFPWEEEPHEQDF